jgi:hypothetical protein
MLFFHIYNDYDKTILNACILKRFHCINTHILIINTNNKCTFFIHTLIFYSQQSYGFYDDGI